MTTTLLYIFAFVVVLSLVVIVHEGGHFIVARLCGVKVVEFSVGFGKKLFEHTDKKGTNWQIRLIPLGGYVKMLGDEDAASSKSSDKDIPEEDKDKTFAAKKLWQRAAIIFAGPGTNYLFAFLLITGLYWGIGEVIVKPVVGSVMPGSAAEEAHILPNDEILSINGTPVQSFADIQRQVRLKNYGKTLTLSILRDTKTIDVVLTPKESKDDEVPMIGIMAAQETLITNKDMSLGSAIVKSATTIWETTRDTLIYLGQVLTAKRTPKDMRGPLGIAEASGDALAGGIISLLAFIAQISIAIGLMNLLPIPLLDGGHLFLYLIEAIRRKPLSEKMQNGLMWMGLIFLLAIFAYTMVLDIPRITKRIISEDSANEDDQTIFTANDR